MGTRLIASAVLALAALVAAPGTALPGGTPVRCVLVDPQVSCGYFASGPGEADVVRVGAWVVRVYRETQLVWALGGQTPARIGIPSQPGDLVQAQIIAGFNWCALPEDVPAPRCNGAGVIVLSEGLL